MGTHERFTAFMIEHFGGAFPTWMAPLQVRIVTVSDQFNEYADKVVSGLRNLPGLMVRVERDPAQDTMGKKIRNATKQKIPNVLIVGEKEQADGTVTLRRYGIEQQLTMPVAEFGKWLSTEITERRLPEWFLAQRQAQAQQNS